MCCWTTKYFCATRIMDGKSHMSDLDLLERIRASLASRVAVNFAPGAAGDQGCASVAIILRIRPESIGDTLASDTPQSETLEILFMKRAVNPRDRWSGHVSFPGGRRDPSKEEAKAAAIREAFEEIGFKLDEPSKFEYLGRLDDRYTVAFRGRMLLISSFVFLQKSTESIQPEMQASECAGLRWIPLNYFLSSQKTCKPVEFSMSKGFLGSLLSTLVSESSLTLQFPGLMLPSAAEASEDYAASPSEQDLLEYHLWGLTLAILDDFLWAGGVASRSSLGADRPYFPSRYLTLFWSLTTLSPKTYKVMNLAFYALLASSLAFSAHRILRSRI